MSINIKTTREYKDWFEKETVKCQHQIETRLSNIKNYDHFGDFRFLDDELYELRWKNGRRIYFTFLSKPNILLLLGGLKNDQKKDISRSKKMLRKIQG